MILNGKSESVNENKEDLNESLKDFGLSKLKTKEEALYWLEVSYPGVNCPDTDRWILYNNQLIELIDAFKLKKDEVKKAMEAGKKLSQRVK